MKVKVKVKNTSRCGLIRLQFQGVLLELEYFPLFDHDQGKQDVDVGLESLEWLNKAL